MSNFKKFGIEHLSPSSLNEWAAAPSLFVLRRVVKAEMGGVGPAAHRGTAVESAVVAGLQDPSASLTALQDLALKSFDNLTVGLSGDKVEKERAAIAGFVEQGLKALKPYGVPVSVQGQVYYDIEGLDVPLMGYYDILFPNGVLVDLKTTHSVPSSISNSHARQVALYTGVLGDEVKPHLCYVSTKKSAMMALENAAEHLKSLSRIAIACQKFLSISEDPLELASMLAPDPDSFYYSDDIARQAAYKVYGV